MKTNSKYPVSQNKEFLLLGEKMESEIERVRMEFADKYLKFFRAKLSPFNTSRHTIKILSGMGVASIMIDDIHLHDFSQWRDSAIVSLLLNIEESLDWDFAAYLDGKRLN